MNSKLPSLAEASKVLTGKAYIEGARDEFLDIPGHLFSTKHRTWAHKLLGQTVTRDVPSNCVSAVTLLSAALPSYGGSFFRKGRMNERSEEMQLRIAKVLRAMGARVAYVNGGLEVAEHKMFQAHERVREYVTAYRTSWPKGWRSKRVTTVWVPHGHFVVVAHNGKRWITRDELRAALKREFTLPHESWVSGRRSNVSQQIAGRFLGYLNKRPREYTYDLMLADAHFRLAVSPTYLWPEGFWTFGPPRSCFVECGLIGGALRRSNAIDALEVTGAAVGFVDRPKVWCEADFIPMRQRRWLRRARRRQRRWRWCWSSERLWIWSSLRRLAIDPSPTRKRMRLWGLWPQAPPGAFERYAHI